MTETLVRMSEGVIYLSGFDWTGDQQKAAILLAQGYTVEKTALECGVSERTIYRWKEHPEFLEEVDHLSLMLGIANRAERLRIAMQVIRQKCKEEGIETNRDLLDWLKYAQSETDGVKLNLTASVFQVEASLAGSGSKGMAGTPQITASDDEPEP